MKRVLVTGATGMLGRPLVEALRARDYPVTATSRRDQPPRDGVRWVRVDLTTGDGLEAALEGVGVIVHAATNPTWQGRREDAEGTRRLLDRARGAGAPHLIYPSIIGIDRMPYFYYRSKLECERLIEASGVPWSSLRIAQFHDFVARFIRSAARLPLVPVPFAFRFQSVDVGDTAVRLIRAAEEAPGGHLTPFAGPEILTFETMARGWLEAHALRKPLVPLPFPGALGRGFRQGLATDEGAERGRVTWRAWLERRAATATDDRAHAKDAGR